MSMIRLEQSLFLNAAQTPAESLLTYAEDIAQNGNITDVEQAISDKWYTFSAQEQKELLRELSELRKHIAELSTPYADAESNHQQRCLALGRVLLENRNYSRVRIAHSFVGPG